MIQPLTGKEILGGVEALKMVARRIKHRFNTDQNPQNFNTVTSAQYREYFKFTIVRNPWARVHSAWKNIIRDSNHYRRLGLGPDTTLQEFVSKTRGIGMLKTQTSWLLDFKGQLAVDYVGRFEELETAFAHICDQLGIEGQRLPHAIRGVSDDYRAAFNDATREMVTDFFSSEIDRFDYTFEN